MPFVLNWVIEESILGLVNRKHCLTASRSPAAENNRNLVLVDEFFGLLRERWPIRGAIFNDIFNFVLLAIHLNTTSCIDFINGHLFRIHQGGLGDCHRASQRMQDANGDAVVIFNTGGLLIATAASSDGQTQRRCGHAGKETLGQ